MAVNKYGLSSENLYDKVKQDIMKSDLFRFNWFFKSRTVQEISKRANTLLSIVTREFESSESLKRKQSEPKKDVSIEGASQASAEPVEKKPKMHEISTQ